MFRQTKSIHILLKRFHIILTSLSPMCHVKGDLYQGRKVRKVCPADRKVVEPSLCGFALHLIDGPNIEGSAPPPFPLILWPNTMQITYTGAFLYQRKEWKWKEEIWLRYKQMVYIQYKSSHTKKASMKDELLSLWTEQALVINKLDLGGSCTKIWRKPILLGKHAQKKT